MYSKCDKTADLEMFCDIYIYILSQKVEMVDNKNGATKSQTCGMASFYKFIEKFIILKMRDRICFKIKKKLNNC